MRSFIAFEQLSSRLAYLFLFGCIELTELFLREHFQTCYGYFNHIIVTGNKKYSARMTQPYYSCLRIDNINLSLPQINFFVTIVVLNPLNFSTASKNI